MKKLLSMLLIATIITSTIPVSAGSTSANFGSGDAKGYAQLSAANAYIEAYTTVESSGWSSAGVRTRCVYQSAANGSTQYGPYDSGWYLGSNVFYACSDAIQFVIAGESYHYVDGSSKHLYCSYS